MGEAGGGPLLVIGMITVEIFAWISLMVAPYGWQRKMTLLFKFDSGLYEATVHPGPLSSLALAMVKSVRKAFTKDGNPDVLTDAWFGGEEGKKYSLSHLEGLFCQQGVQALVGNFCEGFRKLHIGSLILIFMVGTAIVIKMLGGYFYYHYWYVKASKKCHDWVLRFFILAPVFLMFGMSIYTFMATDVNKMDPPNVPGFHYSFFAACVLSVLAWLPFLIQQCFIGLHPKQLADENKAMKLEDDMGTAPPAPMYGSTQGYGAGDAEAAGGYQGDWGQQYPGYQYGQTSYPAAAPAFGVGYSQPQMPPPSAPAPGSFQQSPAAGYAGGNAMPSPPGSAGLDTGILPVSEGGTMPELRARTLGAGEL
mmetsp:Transcript_8619/g.15474  ORF Transcript_8619/g.15474 Transcript_8619/m.15474 type:complete len:364 (+) Transcript_8619:145-1236(+)